MKINAAFCVAILTTSLVAQVSPRLPSLQLIENLGVTDRGMDTLGDVNGDGVEDYVCGSQFGDGFVFSGRDGALLHLLFAPTPSGGPLTTGVAGGADVDQDGVGDIILHTRNIESVRVFSGATGALIHDISGSGIGEDAAFIDDVNGDGAAEFVCSASLSPGNAGDLLFFDGAAGNVIGILNGQPGQALGHIVKQAGDVDGDGVDDYAHTVRISSTIFNTIESIVIRSGADSTILRTLNSPGGLLSFGDDFDAGEDVTGDGVPDIVVSSINGISLFNFQPSVLTVFSGATGAVVRQFTTLGNDAMGTHVSLLGDINGNGHGDIAASGGGSLVLTYDMGTGALIREFTTAASFGDVGTGLAGISDTNGDGFDELVFCTRQVATGVGTSGIGAIDHVQPGGARRYGLGGPPTQTLVHEWISNGGASPSTGNFVTSGASPGSPAFYAISLNDADFTAAAVNVLVDNTPGAIVSLLMNFDANGEIRISGDLGLPQLAGLAFFTQVFEITALAPQFVFSSNGLEQLYTQ